MHHSSGEDKVIRFLLLQHQPHALDIVPGVPPVPHAVQIAQLKTLQLSEVDLSHRPEFCMLRMMIRKIYLYFFLYLVIFLVTKVSPLLGLS